jgi:4-hydroxybenzoate polyprenyltransferase
MKKTCLIFQVFLLLTFAILLVTNILGYVNYDDVRYILYAIVVLSVINLIININAKDDKQISQTAKRNIVIVAVVFGVFVTALVLIQLV